MTLKKPAFYRFHERGGQKSNLFKISEKIINDKPFEDRDFFNSKESEMKNDIDTQVDYCHEDITNVIMNKTTEVKDKKLIPRLLKHLKKGFSYILSWGL